MGGGRQDDGGAIPVEDAFSWMFRPPVTQEQTDAWFQPPAAQPSEKAGDKFSTAKYLPA
jgi:hypothetical protein